MKEKNSILRGNETPKNFKPNNAHEKGNVEVTGSQTSSGKKKLYNNVINWKKRTSEEIVQKYKRKFQHNKEWHLF